MENKHNRKIFIDPLLLMLKSRRVLIALASLLTGFIVMGVPQLAPLHNELLILLVSLSLALIGGLSLEDAVLAAKQTPVSDDMRQLIDAANDAILDELILEVEDLRRQSGTIDNTGFNHSPN